MRLCARSATAWRIPAKCASPVSNPAFALKNLFRGDSTAEWRHGPRRAWRNLNREGARFSRSEKTPSTTPTPPELDHHRGCGADASTRQQCFQNWPVPSYKQIAGFRLVLWFPWLLRGWKQNVGCRFQFFIKPSLPVAHSLPVKQGEGLVSNGGSHRHIIFVQVSHEPVV